MADYETINEADLAPPQAPAPTETPGYDAVSEGDLAPQPVTSAPFRPAVPFSQGVINRMRSGEQAEPVLRKLIGGFATGFGDSYTAITNDEAQKMRDAGWIKEPDPNAGPVAGALRWFGNTMLSDAARVKAGALSLFPAAVKGLSEGGGALAGQVGLPEKETAKGIEQSLNIMGTDASINTMLMSGSQYAEASRVVKNPSTGGLVDQRIGPVPPDDAGPGGALAQANQVATHYGLPDAAPVIKEAYDKGVLPAEIFHDAKTDPTILPAIAEGKVPEAYPTKNWEPPQSSEVLPAQGGVAGTKATRENVAALSDELMAANPGLKLDIGIDSSGVMRLSRIISPEQGSGIGSAIMQKLTDFADQTGTRMALTPSGDFGGNVRRLRDFYKRFGFIDNKGANKDFSISETMLRDPEEGTKAIPAPSPIPENTVTVPTLAGKPPPEAPTAPSVIAFHGSPHKFSEFDAAIKHPNSGGDTFGRGINLAHNEAGGQIYTGEGGNLYKVQVNAAPEKLVDWEATEQPGPVKDAFAGLPSEGPKNGTPFGTMHLEQDEGGKWTLASNEPGGARFPMPQRDIDRMFGPEGGPLTGEQAYRRLSIALGSDAKASEALRKAGVQGIIHNDEHHFGGRDYTIFEPNILKITERNGKPVGAKLPVVPTPPPQINPATESDAAVANITAAGGKVRDIPVGHMITPDGRGVEPFVGGRPIPNHYEVAIDAGYLPPERMPEPGTLVPDADRIVNGMLQRGWIRNTGTSGYPSFSVYNIADVRKNLEGALERYVGPTTKSLYIDEVGSGKSYRVDPQALIDNKFNLQKTLRTAEVHEGPAASAETVETLGAPRGMPEKPPKSPTVPTRLRPIEGTGDVRPMQLSQSVEEAVGKIFDEVPASRVAENAVQETAARKFVDLDPERADQVAMFGATPPKNLLGQMVFNEVLRRAVKAEDWDKVRMLSTQGAQPGMLKRFGQEIQAASRVGEEGEIAGHIQDVQEARAAALKAKGIDIAANENQAAKEYAPLRAAAKVKGPDAWQKFMTSIRCAE